MLLQRLISDDKYGFKNDHMECEGYDTIAGIHGRRIFAASYLADDIISKKVRFFERLGQICHGPVPVVAYGSRNYINGLNEDLILRVTREGYQIDNPEIVAWIRVGYNNDLAPISPLFIVRDIPENDGRFETYFKSVFGAVKMLNRGLERRRQVS